MRWRFTLSHDVLGSHEITEPGGWIEAKIKLERHPEFFSLVQHYITELIFYGRNDAEGVDGGINFIRQVELTYGFAAKIYFLAELADDDVNFETLFRAQLALDLRIEFPNNQMEVPLIRDDIWTTFINRYETPVNLSDLTDLDGNAVDPAIPVTVNLTPQVINQQYRATQKTPSTSFIENETTHPYIQFDPWEEELAEIDEKFPLTHAFNTQRPESFRMEYAGEYIFDLKYCFTVMFVDPDIQERGLFNIGSAWQFDVLIQVNDGPPIQFTQTNFGDNIAGGPTGNDRWSEYTWSGTLNLNAGDTVRIYGLVPANGMDFVYPNTMLVLLGNESGVLDLEWSQLSPAGGTDVNFGPVDQIDTHVYILGKTVFRESQAKGYLIHDLIHGVLARIGLGVDPFYSEFFGSTTTNAKQYDENGCGWMYFIVKGLQLRGYTLEQKPFFISMKDIWDGINPILNLGLGYEKIEGNDVIRIEQKGHFIGDTPAVNFSNVREITSSYDHEFIFKTIRVGYKEWKSEDVSGLDDPQTKHTYATIL